VFTAEHERFWAAARRRHGDSTGTRALIGVLLLHRALPRQAVLAGMTAAVDLDRPDAELVAIEARRHQDGAARPGPATAGLALALTVNDNVPGAPERGAPSLDSYDQLLAVGGHDPLVVSAARAG
jgi:hypothetical protein